MAQADGSILGLGSPPPPSAPREAKRIFTPTQYDATTLRIDQADGRAINAALDAAKRGDMRPCADLNDMVFVHPILGGIIEQRLAGTQGVQYGWTSPNDTPRAADLAAMVGELLPTTSEHAVAQKGISCLQRLRGGGLAEPYWSDRGGVWHWLGSQAVPQQRMRYDSVTREPAFAVRATDSRGVPLSKWDPGTFLYLGVHEDMQHFGYRGYVRRMYTSWHGGTKALGLWGYKVERWDDPALHFASDSQTERDQAEALGKIGPGVVLATQLTTLVKPIQVANSTGSEGSPHHEYLNFVVVLMGSICFLGATQMVAVATKEGAQNSAPGHANVREDIVQADADAYAGDMTAIARHLVTLNVGPDALEDAPRLLPIWKQPVDVGAELDNAKKLDDLGADIGLDELYEKVGWNRPAKGVETVRGARAARAPESSNVLPFPSKGGKP